MNLWIIELVGNDEKHSRFPILSAIKFIPQSAQHLGIRLIDDLLYQGSCK